MATRISDIDSKLSEVSGRIFAARQQCSQAKTQIINAETILGTLASQYSRLITTINGFTPNGAWETLKKNQLALLIAEYQALQTEVTAAKNGLDSLTEF